MTAPRPDDRRARRRVRALGAALVVLALAGAACSGDTSPSTTERPLSDDEAAMLANVLFDNHDRGGADVTLAVQVGEGASLSLQGEIDWTTHRGHALVSARGVETGVREVYWSDDAVLEALGAEIELKDGYLHAVAPRGLKGAVIEQRFASVGATENIVMAATLASTGFNPVTRERVLREDTVRNVLSVMASCGMYESCLPAGVAKTQPRETRRAGVTSGRRPNQCSKPGAAW